MVERVDALDDPRFNRPFPFQAFVEAVYLDGVQLPADILPGALKGGDLLARGFVVGRGPSP